MYTLPFVALMVLAIYLIYKRSRFAEVFGEESARAAAETNVAEGVRYAVLKCGFK